MEGIHELLNEQHKHQGPIEGVFATEPAGVNDPAYVYIQGFDDQDTKVGPCAWSPRGEETPTEGDPCAVALTDADTPVIVAWWGEEWPSDG